MVERTLAQDVKEIRSAIYDFSISEGISCVGMTNEEVAKDLSDHVAESFRQRCIELDRKEKLRELCTRHFSCPYGMNMFPL